ncbi:Peptidoglycan-binding Lysin subgroup [Penicillium griseofulvum]|uniref:Peptidoglycan-binding Lysin subgroup n=1 Tax=Penicillium patulum TaxID=5078 RepID=A0A135LW91_PENPA|nr:Peptidoglycan-binding Lysin subgroup [Penicillium griseofulvum]KXG53226.1 Peptidoglycan-binding Lysin subgroup [Penicillium griseofulvum]
MFRITLVALCLFLLHMTKATAPKPTTDGYCFKYIIQGYDTCSLIAKKHSITEADIESFNKDTWAWLGCDRLYQGDFICLSAGKPPMPMALPQATCGPQVPGTVRPAKWADLAGLNPCPSSKCCAFWGQCGVSELYCQNYRAPPAGPTATVKCATEAPKSLPSSTNKSEPDSKGSKDSNSKSDPKSKSDSKSTTKATTKAEPTTTKTKPTSTKTKKKWTPEPTVSQYPWKAPWEMTMYSELGCEGDYYHLEGYNKKFLDDEGCLAIHGGLNSKFTETGVTCKWWPDGSLTWKNCDAGTLKKPKSWVVKNGMYEYDEQGSYASMGGFAVFY